MGFTIFPLSLSSVMLRNLGLGFPLAHPTARSTASAAACNAADTEKGTSQSPQLPGEFFSVNLYSFLITDAPLPGTE